LLGLVPKPSSTTNSTRRLGTWGEEFEFSDMESI
jgi:hypothetical protein